MTILLLTTLLALTPQTGPTALPDTPQGKRVQAWIAAFNSGDEKAFLAAQRTHMTKAVLDKRPEAERGKMFQRLRGDFGSMQVGKVLKATATEIQLTAPARDGGTGTFTFQFEESAPHLIAGILIDVEGARES